jgi:hypothetical protein
MSNIQKYHSMCSLRTCFCRRIIGKDLRVSPMITYNSAFKLYIKLQHLYDITLFVEILKITVNSLFNFHPVLVNE